MSMSAKIMNPIRKHLVILVDLDCVLADFEGHFLNMFRKRYPQLPFIPLDERRTFYLSDQYIQFGSEFRGYCCDVINEKDFFFNLPPIAGALTAVKDIAAIDRVEVFICTTPPIEKSHCCRDKLEWVRKYLGKEWIGRLILTRDKTLIHGDILIDDKPTITGVMEKPSWEHVLFSACHNKHFSLSELGLRHRMEDWNDMDLLRDLIDQYLRRLDTANA